MESEEEESAHLISSAWDFQWPSTSMLIPDGDRSNPSMQAAAMLQGRAEQQYVNEMFGRNRELQVRLRLRNFALEVAKGSIETLKSRVSSLEAELETSKKKLEEFYQKEEAQNRISREIWGPIRRGGERDTSAWDPLPVMLDGAASLEYMDRPLILTHVALELGYTCQPPELRRLTTLVYDAYIRLHGHAPAPKIWYDEDGTPRRLCCFTQREKDLVISVIMKEGSSLFQDTSSVFQSMSGPEGLMM